MTANPARDVAASVEATAADVLQGLVPTAPGRLAASLDQLLESLTRASSLSERGDWLVALVRWLREPEEMSLSTSATVSGRSPAARLWLFVECLRRAPKTRDAVAALLRSFLDETSAQRLFVETGLPRANRFFAELSNRVARRLLPTVPDERDLAELLARAFTSSADADWLDQLPPVLVYELFAVLAASPARAAATAADRRPREEMADALVVLGVRAGAVGLDFDLRQIAEGGKPVRSSPFLQLPRVCERLAKASRATTSEPEEPQQACEALEACLEQARSELETAHAHLEEHGVSVDLVFRLDLLRRQLDRIGLLARRLFPKAGEAPGAGVQQLLGELVRAELRDRSVGALVQRNLKLLARKVIERTGDSGEHYITHTRAQWRDMLRRGAGGGLLTSITALLKFVVSGAHLAPFFEGLLASLNYAVSFVTLQALGCTLATKQPAMTAAALAGALKQERVQDEDLGPLAELTARISRSQLAAAIGNLALVIPAAALINFAWERLSGHSFLVEAKATQTIASLDPLGSGTVFFAIWTGVLLWAGSLVGGWMENWAVYHRLPEALAHHRTLRRLLGPTRSKRLGRAVLHGIGGVGTSVALGFLLGSSQVFGSFFGFALEVRHVTLSAGTLAFAGSAQGWQCLKTPEMLRAMAGIGVVGCFNFGVSFLLALSVALRAREVRLRDLWRLAKAFALRFVRQPWSFFVPPRDP
ncbi:MAG: gliding motility protein [Deltaproteobacteria bacterium]|nr:gliding motility protein [Deltaproteobacteria bacterium]